MDMFYLVAILAVAAVGYLVNIFAFLPADRFRMLRLIDGNAATKYDERNFC